MPKIVKRNPCNLPNITLLVKRDSIDEWNRFNPVPRNLELICVYDTDGTRRWKLGDGETPFSDLPYVETIEQIMTFRAMYRKANGMTCGVQIELAPQRNS